MHRLKLHRLVEELLGVYPKVYTEFGDNQVPICQSGKTLLKSPDNNRDYKKQTKKNPHLVVGLK